LYRVVCNSKKINKFSTPYSSIEWSDVENIFTINVWRIEPKLIPDEAIDRLYIQLLDCSAAFGTISCGKEIKRRYFIAPILVTVANLFKDDAEKVMILVEEYVEGFNVRADGHFEFVLQKGTIRVCILIATKEKMEKGMAQSLLGCEAIADVKNVTSVYAVVTNFHMWYFMKNTGDQIFRNATSIGMTDDIPCKESVARIAGMLYSLLSEA
jgi:hypothetical protein